MPNQNDIAPDFTLPRDGGTAVTLSALRPAPVVLYFYPKDDTSGCTKEAIGFSEQLENFNANNAVILGVSRDTVKKHDKFICKYGLHIHILHKTGLALTTEKG